MVGESSAEASWPKASSVCYREVVRGASTRALLNDTYELPARTGVRYSRRYEPIIIERRGMEIE